MSSHQGDISTVIGESALHCEAESIPINDSNLRKNKAITFARAGISTEKHSDFTTTDYTLQERPFFVPIGTGGILVALQKLDRQLLDVGEADILY